MTPYQLGPQYWQLQEGFIRVARLDTSSDWDFPGRGLP